MSLDAFGNLNWPAVVAAAIAYFALGAVWFAPQAFGNVWMRAMGWESPEEVPTPGPAIYIGPLITCFLAAIAVGLLAEATGSDTIAKGLQLGLVTGIGISGAVLFVTGVFDPKKPQPMAWFGVTSGYHLMGLLITAVIVSAWN